MSAVTPALAGDGSGGVEVSELWWRKPFRNFQTNLREIDAGMDVEAFLDFLDDFGGNVWLLSVGGIISNYPTKLAFQTANPALVERESGDLVGDAVSAAAERGVRVLGRMDFSKIDRRRAEEHPDWCFVTAAGENQVYNGYYSVCPSGDYYQHRIFDVITEVLSRYDISGFFFNWMSFNEYDYSRRHWGVCHCLACRTGFAAFAPGVPLPVDKDSATYEVWRRYSHGVLSELTGRMQAHVRALKPDAALILGDRSDIVFHEANNAVGRPLWHHATAEWVSAAKSYRPDVPVLCNSVAFVDMPYRLAGEDPDHFAQYLIQSMAHGANPSTYVMGTPADAPYENLAVAGEITRFYRDHAETYTDLVSSAQVVLVRPDALAYPAPVLAEVRSEFEGLYLSLVEGHIPFDVLPANRLAESGIDRYRLVVLPDLGPLDETTVAALDAYVAAGGQVLATGSSGFREQSSQLAGGPVRRRLSSFTTAESLRSLHLRLSASVDRPEGFPIPVVGAFHVTEADERAIVDWPALSRSTYGPPEKCYGHVDTGHPGYAWARSGAGGIGVLPWTIGRVYREVGLSAVRDAFLDRVLECAGRVVRIETSLSEQVQVVVGRSAVGDVVHLLNRTGDKAQRFVRPLDLPAAELSLPWSGGAVTARALVSGVELATRAVDGLLTVSLPPLGRFETVLIQRLSNK